MTENILLKYYNAIKLSISTFTCPGRRNKFLFYYHYYFEISMLNSKNAKRQFFPSDPIEFCVFFTSSLGLKFDPALLVPLFTLMFTSIIAVH